MNERRIDIDEALSALDHMDDFARMADIDPIGPRNILLTFIEQVRNDRTAQPAASAEPSDDVVELISLLRAIRPKYGYVGTRDVDVAAQQHRIDRAIALLPRYGRPAGDAQPVAVHQVFRSDGTWEDVDATARANCEDNGKETRTLYAAPVAAQKADDARDADRYRWLVDSDWYVGPPPEVEFGCAACYDHNAKKNGVSQAIDAARAQERKGEGDAP